ncbi:hypothetical protein BDV96DRAFT_502972 [Lophiotrema nucula]|uniref:Peptidase M20 dimerisation domain-containing protein n=1 Tax=Lophiotrema nucula TaxID=690887 RepID=A0A6A5YQ75_9PLEO|nr:hypothetical protein BDV96DRAFT_502972 [Lophiotrema nucula]
MVSASSYHFNTPYFSHFLCTLFVGWHTFANVAAQSPSASASATSASFTSDPEATLTADETKELFDFHKKLVKIPSTTFEEAEAIQFVFDYISDLGYYVEKVDVDGSRYDVFAYPQAIKDEGTWPEVLITSHLDTVPPYIPFERREENGTIYHFGRGSVDAKGAVAPQIVAAHKFLQARTDTPSLGLLFVVGEETGGDGMKAFAKYAENVTFSAAIFGEPTESKLATGHKGSLGLTLNITGKAAHSAYEWLGVNAIDFLAEGITALNAVESVLPTSELLGNSTINVGRVSGGVASNVVPANANASVSIRVAQNITSAPDDISALIEEALAPLVRRAEHAGAIFNVTFAAGARPAIVLDTDIPGFEIGPVFYGTDIPSLPQVKKKYLYGPASIKVAHGPDEELTQDELVLAAEAYGTILAHIFPPS